MTTARQDARMTSGDTKRLRVTITDSDGVEVDVTGATIIYVIADSQERVRKATGDGITIDGAVVTVTLDPADTAELAGVYAHEMQIVDGAGQVQTVFTGQMSIAKDLIV